MSADDGSVPQQGMDHEGIEARCLTCRLNREEIRAPGGTIYRDALWCLEHAIEPLPMVGWLVLKPMRHVEHFADLTPEEASAFGLLARNVAQAMTVVLRPEKVYLSMYMEAPGFAHLHVHLIPRFADTPPALRGPAIFRYLGESKRTGQNLVNIVDVERAVAAIREMLHPAASDEERRSQ